MQSKLRCPRCAHPVAMGDLFCDYCGYKLGRLTNQDDVVNVDEIVNYDYSSLKSMSRSNKPNVLWRIIKWIIGLIVVIAVVLLGSWYGLNRTYFSKANSLKRILKAPQQKQNSILTTGKSLSKAQRKELKKQLASDNFHHSLVKQSHWQSQIRYERNYDSKSLFNHYRLVVTPAFLEKVQVARSVVKKANPKLETKLTPRMRMAQQLKQLSYGLNQINKNGQAPSEMANLFVDGRHNLSYQDFTRVANDFYQAGKFVKYDFKVKKIKANRMNYDMIYLFGAQKPYHVQKFHWHARLQHKNKHDLIDLTWVDLKPYYDHIINK